jgi:hypothetical protein
MSARDAKRTLTIGRAGTRVGSRQVWSGLAFSGLVWSGLVVAWLGGGTWGAAAQAPKKFPYGAVVRQDDVSVRSGPGRKYYPTSKLRTGERVTVVRHDPGGWYVIQPPAGSFSWVPARAIERTAEGVGTVTVNNTSALVGSDESDLRDVEQRRLRKGESVEILGEKLLMDAAGRKELWLKIAPPKNEWRWVLGQFVTTDVASVTGGEGAVELPGVASVRGVTPVDGSAAGEAEVRGLETHGDAAGQGLDLTATDAEPVNPEGPRSAAELDQAGGRDAETGMARVRAPKGVNPVRGVAKGRGPQLAAPSLDEASRVLDEIGSGLVPEGAEASSQPELLRSESVPPESVRPVPSSRSLEGKLTGEVARAEARRLDARLQAMLETPPETWDLEGLRGEYDQLLAEAEDGEVDALIQTRLMLLKRYEATYREAARIAAIRRATDERDAELTARLAKLEAGEKSGGGNPVDAEEAESSGGSIVLAGGEESEEDVTTAEARKPARLDRDPTPEEVLPPIPEIATASATDLSTTSANQGAGATPAGASGGPSLGAPAIGSAGSVGPRLGGESTGGSRPGPGVGPGAGPGVVAARAVGPGQAAARARFAGAGLVVKSPEKRHPFEPPYRLITPQGKHLAWLIANPGFDLSAWVGKAAGLSGERSKAPQLGSDLIRVTGATAVKLAP